MTTNMDRFEQCAAECQAIDSCRLFLFSPVTLRFNPFFTNGCWLKQQIHSDPSYNLGIDAYLPTGMFLLLHSQFPIVFL